MSNQLIFIKTRNQVRAVRFVPSDGTPTGDVFVSRTTGALSNASEFWNYIDNEIANIDANFDDDDLDRLVGQIYVADENAVSQYNKQIKDAVRQARRAHQT